MDQMTGKAHVFGDNINTDYIIAGKYKFKSLDMNDLATHLMEDVRPGFNDEIKAGRLHSRRGELRHRDRPRAGAAGHQGGGHRRGHRQVLRAHLLPQLHQRRPAGDRVRHLQDRRGRRAEGRPRRGRRQERHQEHDPEATPFPPVMMTILNDGGLAEHLKKHNGFALK